MRGGTLPSGLGGGTEELVTVLCSGVVVLLLGVLASLLARLLGG